MGNYNINGYNVNWYWIIFKMNNYKKEHIGGKNK